MTIGKPWGFDFDLDDPEDSDTDLDFIDSTEEQLLGMTPEQLEQLFENWKNKFSSEGEVPVIDKEDLPPPPLPEETNVCIPRYHHNHTLVWNSAAGERFLYCKDCKVEVNKHSKETIG